MIKERNFRNMKNLLIIVALSLCINTYSQEQNRNRLKKRVKEVEYYENGNIKEMGTKVYQWKTSWTPLGSCGVLAFFKNGRWIEYYPNGKKKRILVYKSGEIEKVRKEWSE